MAVPDINFTTGPASLPDVGVLEYNGCTFSPLFETKVVGTAIKDEAGRTVKLMEYVLTADGYVTLLAGALSVDATMSTLRRLLTAQGGALRYIGRGFDLIVNVGNNPTVADVAWGPVPELLEFQPLGGGASAKVHWQVKVRIVEIAGNPHAVKLLQLNSETTVTYGEDGYSTLSIRGTMEIPLTRRPSQTSRTLTTTVDFYRRILEGRIFAGIDLRRFRVTKRDFSVSRDKRTMTFSIDAEERPYMDMPVSCTVARGSYNVRPAKAGMGLSLWLCTLKGTYTVRADVDKRVAWIAFLGLLRLRMAESARGTSVPGVDGQNPDRPQGASPGVVALFFNPFAGAVAQARQAGFGPPSPSGNRRAFLIDFSIDEGLYLDSKTIAFSATWRLVTIFSHIIRACGLWTKLPEVDNQNRNLWATSMRNVQGSTSWLGNQLDPALDVIVDFGGGV